MCIREQLKLVLSVAVLPIILTLQFLPTPVQAIDNGSTAPIQPVKDAKGSYLSTSPLDFHDLQGSSYHIEQQIIKAAKKKAELKRQQEAIKEAELAAQREAARKAAEAEAARLAAIHALDQQRATQALSHSQHVSPTFVAGNDYDYGNCTWYVANRRSVPAGLGNARDWLANAQARGMLTGNIPKVGAVAWAYPGYSLGHVAVVEAVYPDGSFMISEMNVVGFAIKSTRSLTSTSNWQFIY